MSLKAKNALEKLLDTAPFEKEVKEKIKTLLESDEGDEIDINDILKGTNNLAKQVFESDNQKIIEEKTKEIKELVYGNMKKELQRVSNGLITKEELQGNKFEDIANSFVTKVLASNKDVASYKEMLDKANEELEKVKAEKEKEIKAKDEEIVKIQQSHKTEKLLDKGAKKILEYVSDKPFVEKKEILSKNGLRDLLEKFDIDEQNDNLVLFNKGTQELAKNAQGTNILGFTEALEDVFKDYSRVKSIPPKNLGNGGEPDPVAKSKASTLQEMLG